MKKLITLILVFSAWNSFAQLTFVKSSDKSLTPFQLTNGKWMLFSTEIKKNKLNNITLYNKDYSVFKIIPVSQVFPYDTNSYSYNGIYINSIKKTDGSTSLTFTDKFINNDDKLEFILTYYSSSQYYLAKSIAFILNEDGEVIQKFINPSGDLNFKFWDYLNVNFEDFSEKTISTDIYSIPGNLPCPFACNQKPASISPIDPSNAVNKLSIEGFPNPTSEKITLAYTLPKGSSYGTIRLYSQTGTLVKEFKVTDQFDHLELPVADYAAGTYFYELQVDGNSSGGKKMLVVH
jgi:hypothetical protein